MSAEQTPDIAAVGDGPYTGKTIAEIVHDYGYVRGDLTEQYARDQLVRIIEGRIAAAVREAEQRAWDEGFVARTGTRASDWRNPYRADRVAVDAPEGGEGR